MFSDVQQVDKHLVFFQINYIDKMAKNSPMETGNFVIPTCNKEDTNHEAARLSKVEDLMSYKYVVTHGITWKL